MNPIAETLDQSIAVKQKLLADKSAIAATQTVAELLVACYQRGGKVLLCGNGGSAADAQHIAAELSGRFLKNRPALYAEALHANSSFVTAVANDFGYDAVFERAIEAQGRKGDVLLAFSTSGNSPNVLRAVQKANKLELITVAFTGAGGGALASLASVCITVPSTSTARIQECHITLGHALCAVVEAAIFP